jgi:hypothetical protein
MSLLTLAVSFITSLQLALFSLHSKFFLSYSYVGGGKVMYFKKCVNFSSALVSPCIDLDIFQCIVTVKLG